MSDIEELLRESLRTAPAMTPAVSDPLDVVAARVRRARALWGGGVVAAVAVVVAAIVVPLSLQSSAAGDGRLVPSTGGSSPASVSSSVPGVTVWQQQDAVALTSGGGWLWELERNPKATDGSGYVVKVDPRSHEQVQKWDVVAPYDFVAYGLDRIWVWGGGDGSYPDGTLQVVDPATGIASVRTQPGRGFGGVAFLDGHAWVTTGADIWEFDAAGRKLSVVPLVGRTASSVAIYAAAGRLFAQTSPASIQQVIPNTGGIGAHLGQGEIVVDATVQLLGVEGTGILLVSTGADVERQRATSGDMLGNAVFNASPTFAVALGNNNVVAATSGTNDGSLQPALWLAIAQPDGTLCWNCVRKIADGDDVVSLVANPGGGADFVLADGTAEHWQS